MRSFLGFFPAIQRIAFYGIISLILAYSLYDVNLEILFECAFHPETFSDGFLAYMFWSIPVYFIFTLFYAVGRKYWGFGPSIFHFEERSLVYFFFHDITGHIIVPFIFLGMIFDTLIKKEEVFQLEDIVDFIIFMINFAYIVVSFLIIW